MHLIAGRPACFRSLIESVAADIQKAIDRAAGTSAPLLQSTCSPSSLDADMAPSEQQVNATGELHVGRPELIAAVADDIQEAINRAAWAKQTLVVTGNDDTEWAHTFELSEDDAAARIQKAERARQTRRQDAATKIQAVERGRQARRRVKEMRARANIEAEQRRLAAAAAADQIRRRACSHKALRP